MILRKIHLQSFRCFGAPTQVGPLSPRLSVIHGPNGIGKSTLLIALERALFDRPDSQAAEIDALRPWGANVQPKVAVDFTVGDEEYRIEKSFGTRGHALLLRGSGRERRAWQEGTPAVEWLRALLGGQQPARGATRPEHRGLAQVLFVPQGALELPERLGEGAVERLRSVVQSSVVGEATRAIESELKRRYDQHFTATGQPKKGAPVSAAKERLALAESDRAHAEEELARRDQTALALGAAERALAAAEAERLELARAEEELGPRVRLHRALREKESAAARALEKATRTFSDVAERIQTLSDLRAQLAGFEARAAGLVEADRAAAETVAAAARALEEAGRARAAHEARRAAFALERRRVEEARRLARLIEELGELGPRLEGLRLGREQVERLSKRLSASPGNFSGQRIRELRELLAEERSARERLSALKLRVTVHARAQIALVTPDGPVALEKGAQHQLEGEGTLTLSIGDALIEIAGPTVDLDQARAALADFTSRADILARELGSRDPSELEVRRAEHKKLESDLAIARAQLATLAAGESDEALLRRSEGAQRERERILGERPEWQDAPPEPHRLEEVLREKEQAREAERRTIAAIEETRANEHRAAERARELSRTALSRLHDEGQLARGRLQAVESDGLTDAAREQHRRERSLERQEAEDTLELARRALAELAGDPEAELERTRRALDGLTSELGRLTAERARLGERLADGAAPHARLAEAEERAAISREELARAELDAESVRLLWTLFTEEHTRLASQLVGPVAQKVMPRLKRLSGARFTSLELDENLRPQRVGLDGVDEPVASDALSYGTRDQLALLVRLALGEILAGEGPLPVVLDDPLVHADRPRHATLLKILEESARRLQIIVLTCRPEDYRALGGATFVDLAAAPELFPLEG